MKSKKIKTLTIPLWIVILLVFSTVPVAAKEDAIPSITVNALLSPDGSAIITEIWQVKGVSSGTEYYKALENMEGMRVHSLQVWDESGTPFQALDTWDTNRSLEEKAYTSGIIEKSDGYELCWGIGSYGDHVYILQYTIDGLVKLYGDYAGFYHQFISQLSSTPEDVSVSITMVNTPFTTNNARIWAYGFTGEVMIQEGNLLAFSHEPLERNDYVNILCRFDKGLFPTAPTANIPFEKLQELAEDTGSHNLFNLILIGIGVAIAGIIGLNAYSHARYTLADGIKVKLPRRSEIPVNCSVPFDANIPMIYATMRLLRRQNSLDELFNAYLIQWQKEGYIRVEERERERKGKKPKKEEALVLGTELPPVAIEQSLYRILAKKADDQGILWASVMEKHAEELYEQINDWETELCLEGKRELVRLGLAAPDRHEVVRFTQQGFNQAIALLGSQKYLRALKDKDEAPEVPRELWPDYLILAALFGLGEPLIKSLQHQDPEYFDTFAGYYGYEASTMVYFMTMTNHISSTPTVNIGGTGGMSTPMGGGGFSGGGGGGSR